jgi:hypothetical protein
LESVTPPESTRYPPISATPESTRYALVSATPEPSPSQSPGLTLAARALSVTNGVAITTVIQTVPFSPTCGNGATVTASGYAVASGPPCSGGKSVLDTLNAYRGRLNVSQLTWDNALAANSLFTGTANGGGRFMCHHMNGINMDKPPGACQDLASTHPFGSTGEVITPGADDGLARLSGLTYAPYTPFEVGLVGSWLCEAPDDTAVAADCPRLLDPGRVAHGMTAKDKDHYDILSDKHMKHTRVGCVFVEAAHDRAKLSPDDARWGGQWTCNLS